MTFSQHQEQYAEPTEVGASGSGISHLTDGWIKQAIYDETTYKQRGVCMWQILKHIAEWILIAFASTKITVLAS